MVRCPNVLPVTNQFTLLNKCLLLTENHFTEVVYSVRSEVAGNVCCHANACCMTEQEQMASGKLELAWKKQD